MKRALFLDKDGTLIENVPFNVDPALITLSTRSLRGLRLLQARGFLLIVVSNQPGVAFGRFRESELCAVERELRRLLSDNGIRLDAFFYCPHHPAGAVPNFARLCVCRKPRPGMLYAAAHHFDIDLSRSWMIGDILDDVEAGKRAGCRTALIDNGNETEWKQGTPERFPDVIASTIDEAAQLVVDYEVSRGSCAVG